MREFDGFDGGQEALMATLATTWMQLRCGGRRVKGARRVQVGNLSGRRENSRFVRVRVLLARRLCTPQSTPELCSEGIEGSVAEKKR